MAEAMACPRCPWYLRDSPLRPHVLRAAGRGLLLRWSALPAPSLQWGNAGRYCYPMAAASPFAWAFNRLRSARTAPSAASVEEALSWHRKIV